MPFWAELTVAVLLVIGGLFALVGSFALIRLPDPMTRLHGPTKATTLGVGGVLIASMVYSYVMRGEISTHELLISVLLFLTAPIAGLFIAKVHLHQVEDQNALPQPSGDAGWAGYALEGPARGVRDMVSDEDDDHNTSD